jgi:membrane-bound serine protease (ClpP class)
MPVGANTAFVLLIFGVAGIYLEFIRPGRIVPGILGAGAALAGGYFLFRWPLDPAGIVLIAAGTMLLIGEALWGPYFVLGVLGTIAFTAGFAVLVAPPRRIAPAVAIPVSALFGLVTTLLASIAKRSRRKKWADIENPK